MSEPLFYPESQKALEKAADALDNAVYNLKGGYNLATANRAYYSCYYCMSALLYTKDVFARTHQGVRAKFSELFIKDSAVFSAKASDIIASLFDYRQEADYDLDADISAEEAINIVNNANEFYILCKDHYQKIMDAIAK